MTINPDIIGYLAAFLTTAAFIPQALKVWRENDTKAISLSMYSMFIAGIILWLAYGVLIGSMPITAANLITCVLASSILYKKIQHRNAEKNL